jgi:hypothetical protein
LFPAAPSVSARGYCSCVCLQLLHKQLFALEATVVAARGNFAAACGYSCCIQLLIPFTAAILAAGGDCRCPSLLRLLEACPCGRFGKEIST